MSTTNTIDPTRRNPLRLWPGIVIAALLVLVRFVLPAIMPRAMLFEMTVPMVGVLGGFVLALLIVVWWIFFSRAPWSERVGAVVLMIAGVAVARLLVHESIRGGHMGMMLFIYAPPFMALALVAWAVTTRGLPAGARRVALAAAILLACAGFTLVRTDGITGDGVSQLAWRWTETREERLLAQGAEQDLTGQRASAPVGASEAALEPRHPDVAEPRAARKTEPTAPAPTKTAPEPVVRERGPARVEWPGFRGPNRDGAVSGVQINTDWVRFPPVEMWRRPIGPGWSSFAVHGDLVYTQEQRGDHEVVSCHRLSTGEPVWQHRDAVRFYESNGGAGPRGTPTLHNGRLYSLGATGILNVLDAGSGAPVWSRNAATDTGVDIPDWGVASSPLVVDDVVIVAISGQLVAYETRTGEPRWFGPKGGAGYSSPHLATIAGVPQVLLLRGSRTISVAPADGTLLWEHVWQPGASIVQPAFTADGDVLITVGDAMGGQGMRRLAVARGPSGWTAEERWTSRGLKPYFNDFVVHNGHAYGFDGFILACIDLNDGERRWKGGRYGHGQLVLLADQDLLLVISEDGDLALVSATPDQFTEVARFKAIEGKTWNHPVVVGDILLVRNGEEMAAFRLPPVGPVISLADTGR